MTDMRPVPNPFFTSARPEEKPAQTNEVFSLFEKFRRMLMTSPFPRPEDAGEIGYAKDKLRNELGAEWQEPVPVGVPVGNREDQMINKLQDRTGIPAEQFQDGGLIRLLMQYVRP